MNGGVLKNHSMIIDANEWKNLQYERNHYKSIINRLDTVYVKTVEDKYGWEKQYKYQKGGELEDLIKILVDVNNELSEKLNFEGKKILSEQIKKLKKANTELQKENIELKSRKFKWRLSLTKDYDKR